MTTSSPSLPIPRHWLLFAVLFAVASAFLAAGYYWFLRTDFAVLAARVRPEQAATMVDQLKKDGVRYELRDGGTTILVPAASADLERVEMAGEDLPLKGTVGFELFNQSDMGLTDFAQKVNYQRALQGEIARTIMSMDGIAYARVHLAIPERSLFRTSTSEPRAAVTITPQPGVEIDAGRIAGIQRLVAAAVPDLALDQVALLNERGELLTPEFSDVPGGRDENATEGNYRERALAAAAAAAPRAHVEARVTLVPRLAAGAVTGGDGDGASGEERSDSLRVVLFERQPLLPFEEQSIRAAVEKELALDPARGDQLSFSPPTENAALVPQTIAVQPAPVQQAAPLDNAADKVMAAIVRGWTLASSVLAIGALVLVALSMRRRRDARRDALASRIREQLLLPSGAFDVA